MCCGTISDMSNGQLVYGCMDPSAFNYNSDANTDDGSCEYDDLPQDCEKKL